MQEKDLFEYAIIRLVPRVEREEFMNVGVILYCQKQNFLKTKFHVDPAKLSAFHSEIDLEEIQSSLHSFEQICKGAQEGGPIGLLSIGERFRWLTATRSTVIQASKVHPGFCIDAEETLQQLYKCMVE